MAVGGLVGWLAPRLVALLAIAVGVAVYIGNAPPVKPLACYVAARGCPVPSVTGTVADGWAPVLDRWKANFDAGYELGAQFSVFHRNVHVVDAVAGFADRTFTTPFANDTLQMVFSSTKVVEALVIAMLVDRGHLQYDAPIATYWPEFAQGGKAAVTVGDLLSHGGGVAHVSRPIDVPMFEADRRASGTAAATELSDLLAATQLDERVWRQRGHQGYHAISRGWYASQLCRRADPKHRNIDDFARDEIVKPLGLDFRIGVPTGDRLTADVARRLGTMDELPVWKVFTGLLPRMLLPQWLVERLYHDRSLSASEVAAYADFARVGTPGYGALAMKALINVKSNAVSDFARPPLNTIESPSSHGFTTAHSMARIAQALVNGGTDPLTGTVLLSSATLAAASEFYPFMADAVLGDLIAYSRGGWGRFATGSQNMVDLLKREDAKGAIPKADGDRVANLVASECIGWGGYGGSLFQWCPSVHLAFAYVPNHYAPHIIDWRGAEYLTEAIKVAQRA